MYETRDLLQFFKQQKTIKFHNGIQNTFLGTILCMSFLLTELNNHFSFSSYQQTSAYTLIQKILIKNWKVLEPSTLIKNASDHIFDIKS